jgi:hypothetical protein
VSGFENHAESVRSLEREIIRKGLILGIDWENEADVRALAHEAFTHAKEDVQRVSAGSKDARLMAKVDLFGLAALMLKTFQESADEGVESHGGPVWKAFARALWAECEQCETGSFAAGKAP